MRFALMLASASLIPALAMAQFKYPNTQKTNQQDVYFGKSIEDPYRWLENDTAADTKAWVKQQNEVTFGYLNQLPLRNKLRDKLKDLFNYPKTGVPIKAGEYYLFSRNDGLQNQAVWFRQKGLDGNPERFLDPNTLSSKGTVTANPGSFSHDKKFVSINIQRSGSDWQELEVMEVATGKKLADKILWAKFTGAAWKDRGFYYSRYAAPVEGLAFSAKNEHHKIYYHVLGESQEEDNLVFEDPAHPLRYHNASVTDDQRYLILSSSEGTDGNEIRIKDLRKGGEFMLVFPGFAYNYFIIDNIDDQLLVYTNHGAPNYRLVQVDPLKPQPENWKTIIAEKPQLLDAVTFAGGKLFATYLQDVANKVWQLNVEGKVESEIVLPAPGTVSGFDGEKSDTEVFYTFTSFTYPSVIYRYNIAKGQSIVFKKSEARFNPEDYTTEQVFYPTKDGTKIPMFIVYKKGLKKNGKNPCLLYGYGGFNINITPAFSPATIALLDEGAVYASANLRGGGEYGESWHKAGMLLKKQNVFDDFIAAAEYLIRKQYTSKDKLAISGRSNGGLLVGACMTQRPDLFKVAFPAVGVLDMLRFHKFTIGWGWVVEYGSSERSKEEFDNLLKYSPLHQLKAGIRYPSTLVLTADHDDRVVPAHSFKFAATLQEKHQGKNPVLIRIDTQAGHGAGRSITKVMDEFADMYAFMLDQMDIGK